MVDETSRERTGTHRKILVDSRGKKEENWKNPVEKSPDRKIFQSLVTEIRFPAGNDWKRPDFFLVSRGFLGGDRKRPEFSGDRNPVSD